MSTSNVDSSTMNRASKGVQNNNTMLQNSAQNGYNFQNQQRNAQFGPNGSLTGFMNPNSLNVTNPTGAYATQYKNESNQINQGVNQSIASANRDAANQGGGVQPSGFSTAQHLMGYLTGANQRANLFAQNTMAQQNQATQNFWNAQNAYGSAGNEAGQQANQGLGAANSANTSLYGNASQQKKSWLNSLGGVVAGGVGAM